jgi:heavy metal translocating P-type ATPase
MPRRYSLTVEGMHCAACAETVANALRKVTGVKRALVNFATERALVEVDDGVDFSALADAVKQAGYRLATQTVTFALPQPLSDENLRALQGMAGVLAVERNATGATPTVTIRYLDGTVSRHEVRQRLQALGYDAQPLEAESPEKLMRDEAEAFWQRAWIGLALSFVVMALTMLPSLTHRAWASWIAFALTTFVLLWVGTPFFRRALTAALRRTATMDTLVSIGALSAYAYSTWSLLHWSLPHWSLSHWSLAHSSSPPHLYFDSAAFILSAISLGKGLEARARALATASLRRLVSLLPATATVIRDGVEQQVALEAVQVGDLVLVRAGERVPVDGIVVAGKGSVDESLLTGESEPVVKGEGDEVLGGSVCVDGFLQVEALRVGEATFVAQMARLMDEAQATKPAMQRLADKVAAVFVPIVLLLAAATFFGWFIVAGDVARALVAAVSVTVIACPCAMGLATPTAIAVALGRLAQKGILVRNAEAMEKAASITTVILDKTGTITQGQMRVVAFWSAKNASPATRPLPLVPCPPSPPEDELLAIAASAERGSLHPIAQAIVQAATERHLPMWELAEVRTEVGAGVAAKVVGWTQKDEWQGGQAEVFVGKVDAEGLPEGTPVAEWLDNGWTVVGVWVNGELMGCIALADALRPDAQDAVSQLKKRGIKVIMATGDKPQAAVKVAQQLGCDDVLALATPRRKAQLVRECQEQGEKVLMVGDGINDAVALAQADIGVAIATGTELAAAAADVLLVTDRLMALAELLQVGRRTKRIMAQNLFWAFAYNMAALPLAALGKLNPMVAAVAMALSSVTVVGNALRLRKSDLPAP